MKEFRPAKNQVEVPVGESVRILRELQELSQSQLSELIGIPQATISAIENGRVNLGVARAKIFARAIVEMKVMSPSPASGRGCGCSIHLATLIT